MLGLRREMRRPQRQRVGRCCGLGGTAWRAKKADGTYLEDRAVAQHLGGDQSGMMNETGAYPGQEWLWLYTFWYQIKPFSDESNSWGANADAIIFGIMTAAQPRPHAAAVHSRAAVGAALDPGAPPHLAAVASERSSADLGP